MSIYIFFIMSIPKLVTPTFSSGLESKEKDPLITVDAYTAQKTEIYNQTADSSDSYDLKQLKFMTSKSQENIEMKKISDKNQISINKDSLLSGVLSSSSKLSAALKSLPNKIQDGITTVQGASKILATVSGITKTIRNADLSTLNGVANMINDVTNSRLPIEFRDIAGLAKLSANLIKTADRLSIPKSFSAFSSTINDLEMMSRITKDITSYTINNSSTRLLRDIASTKYAPTIKQHTPDFIQQYTSKYKKPDYATDDDIFNEYSDMDYSFDKIDPQWNTCTRNNSSVINATPMYNASDDFKYVLRKYSTKFQNISSVVPNVAEPLKVMQSTVSKVKYATTVIKQTKDSLAQLKSLFPKTVFT